MESAVVKEESGCRGQDARVNTYDLLRRKCEEYEKMNDNMLAQTKKIRGIIANTEREKSILIKRLEQFEVLDEIPKSRFSLTPDPSVLDDDKALLVAAIRIRAELDAELARLKARDEDDPKLASIPNSAHHAGGMSPSNSITSSSALHVVSTPLQSPVASVVVTPSSLVPASVPTLSTVNKAAKGKKTKASKGHLQVPAEKQKALSLKRKKPDADPNAPKKPSNAFFWFCQERRAALQEKFRGEGMSGQHDLTKALAKLWSETAAEDKKKYYLKYSTDKERYDNEMKAYTSKMKFGTVTPVTNSDSKRFKPSGSA